MHLRMNGGEIMHLKQIGLVRSPFRSCPSAHLSHRFSRQARWARLKSFVPISTDFRISTVFSGSGCCSGVTAQDGRDSEWSPTGTRWHTACSLPASGAA